MVSIADLHNNRRELDGFKARHEKEFSAAAEKEEADRRATEERAAKEAAKKEADRRTYLLLLSAEPISTQIGSFLSLEAWRQQYQTSGVSNKKVDQIIALERLQEWSRRERAQSERSLTFDVKFDTLPLSKREQCAARLRNRYPSSSLDKCFVRVYTSAEWAFEAWATKAGLAPLDLNAINLFDHQDYRIRNHDRDLNIDVKTTISVGRCEMKSFWSPVDIYESDEIICAVRSKTPAFQAGSTSDHYLQGVFHSPLYKDIPLRLKYFTLNRSRFNACYFHAPDIFFPLERQGAPQTQPIDKDVREYCVENGKYLTALFQLPTLDAAALLRNALSPIHHDFVPVAVELMNRNMRYLLPHYLADYLLTRILSKESIDTKAVKNVLWSIFEPYDDQKLYLRMLIEASKILPSVRCAHHPDEGMDRMDIDVCWGSGDHQGKIILRARCPTDPKLGTTFLAYSRKTGQTLVYHDRGVTVCDAPRCGCLTHMHDGERIGRRSCPKYGDRTGRRQTWS